MPGRLTKICPEAVSVISMAFMVVNCLKRAEKPETAYRDSTRSMMSARDGRSGARVGSGGWEASWDRPAWTKKNVRINQSKNISNKFHSVFASISVGTTHTSTWVIEIIDFSYLRYL